MRRPLVPAPFKCVVPPEAQSKTSFRSDIRFLRLSKPFKVKISDKDEKRLKNYVSMLSGPQLSASNTFPTHVCNWARFRPLSRVRSLGCQTQIVIFHPN